MGCLPFEALEIAWKSTLGTGFVRLGCDHWGWCQRLDESKTCCMVWRDLWKFVKLSQPFLRLIWIFVDTIDILLMFVLTTDYTPVHFYWIILAHRWLQVQELHGVWHPLPEPEWYKTQSLGAKSPFRCVWRSFGETLWEQRLIRIEWMSDIRMMQQNFFNLLAALSRYMTWHTTHSRRISQNVRSLGLYETFYVCFCLSGSPCICSDLSITQNS